MANLATRTYYDLGQLVEAALTTGATLRVEMDDGVFDMAGDDLRTEWDDLAPGEAFDIHGAVTDAGELVPAFPLLGLTVDDVQDVARVEDESGVWVNIPFSRPGVAGSLLLSEREAAELAEDIADAVGMRPFTVVSNMGPRMPESIMGRYSREFDAQAVADAWNRSNGSVATYRVEKDY